MLLNLILMTAAFLVVVLWLVISIMTSDDTNDRMPMAELLKLCPYTDSEQRAQWLIDVMHQHDK